MAVNLSIPKRVLLGGGFAEELICCYTNCMFEKYLQNLGFTSNEAVIYISLLKVDGATALDLSKKTNINRSTVYVTIESLAQKGLVSETTVGKKTQFTAESPERIKTYIERRKLELEEMEKRMEDVIPQMKSIMRDSGERPVVKYFEGRDGIISAIEDFLVDPHDGKVDGETYLIYPKDLLEDIFTDAERKKYREMRIGKNIKSKVLYTSEKSDKPSDNTGERIKIDGGKYPITCDISVYKDRVRINILGKKLSGIFIKSQDLADTLRSIFNLAYDKLKESK